MWFPKSSIAILACAAAFVPWQAAAQFQGLTTTSDGSLLYFSSPTRHRDTSQTFHSKIFRWDSAGGIRVVAEVQSEGQSDGCVTDSFYQLQSPRVSGDGTVFAYTASRPLPGFRLCPAVETNQAVIGLPGRQVKLDGTITLSPNGRYAITTPLAASLSSFHVVTDLASGTSIAVAGAFAGPPQRVTDAAAIVTPSGMAIVLTDRDGATRLVQTRYLVNDVIVDPSGKTLVYVTALAPDRAGAVQAGRISAIDLATGRETQLTTNFAPGNPVITSHADTVFFTDVNLSSPGSQLYAIAADGTGLRQVSHEPDGIDSATVSANGLVAYVVTRGARLVRIDVPSGASTELAPATPLIDAAYVAFTRTTVAPAGSWVTILGAGLASTRRLTLCGQPLPVVSATTVQFQVPLTFQEGPCQLVAETDSPLEHAIDLAVQKLVPQFMPVLLHQNLSGTITQTAPARPGEVIVAYMTGLGPVDDNSQVMAGFTCRVGSVATNVPYAGAAPGYPGYYQINIVVPNVYPGSESLSCGWDALMQIMTTAIWIG